VRQIFYFKQSTNITHDLEKSLIRKRLLWIALNLSWKTKDSGGNPATAY